MKIKPQIEVLASEFWIFCVRFSITEEPRLPLPNTITDFLLIINNLTNTVSNNVTVFWTVDIFQYRHLRYMGTPNKKQNKIEKKLKVLPIFFYKEPSQYPHHHHLFTLSILFLIAEFAGCPYLSKLESLSQTHQFQLFSLILIHIF